MKTIGLALGGGSARGCAHAGVIQALQEAKIPIHMVAGTSIGALVGGVFAAGALEELITVGKKINWQLIVKHLDLAFPRKGLMSGKRIQRFLEELLPIKNIEKLPIPFCAVATDILTAEEIHLTQGPLSEAIRASFSLPAIFSPVEYKERLLVDGGLVNPLPVNVLRKMGAEIVIAVDINHDKNRSKPEGMNKEESTQRTGSLFEQLQAQYHDATASMKEKIRQWTKADQPAMFDMLGWSVNIMQDQVTQKNLVDFPADILIRPPLGHIRGIDFHKAEEMMEVGYEAAQKEMKNIQEKVGQRSP